MISALQAFLNTVAFPGWRNVASFSFNIPLNIFFSVVPLRYWPRRKWVISSTPGGCCKRANKIFEETHTNTSQGLLSNSCNARIQHSFTLLRTRPVCCTIQSPTAVKVTDNSGHNARELRVVYSACALYMLQVRVPVTGVEVFGFCPWAVCVHRLTDDHHGRFVSSWSVNWNHYLFVVHLMNHHDKPEFKSILEAEKM